MITEPILQNIGVVRPRDGYLAALRALADEFGFLLIFDEVKTGFRHALGGYSEICGVKPDLVTYGKAVANGFPLALLGGKREYMDYIMHPDAGRRPLVSGTYNGHPVAVTAAIRTIEYLLANRTRSLPARGGAGPPDGGGTADHIRRASRDGVDRAPRLGLFLLLDAPRYPSTFTTSSSTMISSGMSRCDAR